MPRLATPQEDIAPATRVGQSTSARPPWPGYPNGLERETPQQRAYMGHRFGIDTPYFATFAGWGELIPLTEQDVAEGGVVDVVVLAPPTG